MTRLENGETKGGSVNSHGNSSKILHLFMHPKEFNDLFCKPFTEQLIKENNKDINN